ncbi:MAG: glutathione S-transferase family protein [Myxococcota bacterium]
MPKIVVFGAPASPFVEKVRRALYLKKLEYELTEPKGPGDLKKWSPVTGKMPVVQLDAENVYDSSFICQRLDELHPEPPLFSREPRARAAQRMLEDWADESLYWSLMALRWTEKNTPATLAEISAGLPVLMRPLARQLLKRQIGRQAAVQGQGRLPEEIVVRELGTHIDDLIVLLGERPFFYADEPSAADLGIFAMFKSGLGGPTPEFNELVGERPGFASYLERVRAASGG